MRNAMWDPLAISDGLLGLGLLPALGWIAIAVPGAIAAAQSGNRDAVAALVYFLALVEHSATCFAIVVGIVLRRRWVRWLTVGLNIGYLLLLTSGPVESVRRHGLSAEL